MQQSVQPTTTLNSGVEMPMLGLGVYQTDPGETTRRAVLDALEVGYRHVDTASLYGNEADVGEAIRESGVPREEVFVTTKLWNSDQGYDSTKRAFERSLNEMGFDYLDLYMIHYPQGDASAESWRAMEELVQEGTARAIGVANFGIRHIEDMLGGASTLPAVDQVEFHPGLYKREILDYCAGNGIRLEAYSPLARAEAFRNETIVSIADRLGKTPAQVMLRWSLQHGVIVIPKSTRRERIAENAGVFDFELSGEDVKAIDDLGSDWRLLLGRD